MCQIAGVEGAQHVQRPALAASLAGEMGMGAPFYLVFG